MPPAHSSDARLTLLAREGGQKDCSREVLERLPKEALAHPRGPLAVIGHSDLAHAARWRWSV
ncbi:hypothetical protein F0U59_03525 [Archangium gephyra]|nr:hypothetical protein F0U59_03525 [Archangium gephyra]